MRITNNMLTSKYVSNLNTSLETLNDLSDKVATRRAFNKVSDDPARALKAFQVRRSLSRIRTYENNISNAKTTFTDMETALQSLNDTLTDISTEVEKGKNGTYNQVDKDIMANVLKSLQTQILEVGNTKTNGKYLFGGSNVKNMPFTFDAGGNLLYNGQNVDTATFGKDEVYVDIGMGFDVDASGNANSNSALNIAYTGNELLGSGVDANGLPNNLYNLVGQIITKFQNNDMTDIDLYAKKLTERQDDIIVQYANIGEKVAFTDFLTSRFEKNEDNSVDKQTTLETVDLAEAVMNYKDQKNCYDSALKLGSYILQASLIDYLA